MFLLNKPRNSYISTRKNIIRNYQTNTKCNATALETVYRQSIIEEVKKMPEYVDYRQEAENEGYSAYWDIDIEDNVKHVIKPYVEYAYGEDLHPGPRNILCFVDEKGQENLIMYGHNNTHSVKTDGLPNIYFGPNSKGGDSFITKYARITIPMSKKAVLENGVIDFNYQNSNRVPLNFDQRAYDILGCEKISAQLKPLKTSNQVFPIENFHKQVYFTRPPHAQTSWLSIGNRYIPVIFTDISDPVVQISINKAKALALDSFSMILMKRWED